ncbi:hypothetical protein ED733_000337 [Metarhizium rileyi]|uniref:Aldehyde dehydrogenase domain-containing protein n=1 Tax=Metarhizium rileyi (strain RCEF 4871) TaxID=1649241 RepID=A0A5C6G9M2_METRR|nr:hypothetical protein ED733_000337 [Metarhizium rileyi]
MCNLDDLDVAISATSEAFPIWRAYSGRQRGRIIRKLFDLIAENMVDVGTIITAGNGKARPDGEGEAMFAAGFFEWFSEEAPRSYGDIAPHSAPNSRIQILKQPVGVLKSDGITPFATNVLAVKR